MTIHYLKIVAIYLAYMLIGAIAAIIVGYLGGAIFGLLLVFYSSFTSETAHSSYWRWANFCGYYFALLAILPGVGAGFFVRLIKEIEK